MTRSKDLVFSLRRHGRQKQDSEGATLNTLTFSLDEGAPTGASIDPTSGVFTWTPSEDQGPGTYTVTVRVTDDGTPALDDFETITITVGEVNAAPELAAIGTQNINEGSELTFTASATDPDLDSEGAALNTLTFSLDEGAPTGASIDPTSGVFTWTPSEDQGPGTYTVTVRVTDDGTPALDDFETITITVGEVNAAPELAAIGTQNINEGSELTFTASATDPDLDSEGAALNTLTFSLDEGAPTGASIDPTSGVFTWTPSEDQGPGTYTVTVRVTDDGTPALDDFETITITVGEVNAAPELAAIGTQNINEGSELTFTASATDPDLDSEGAALNTLTFSLDEGAPTGASIDPTSGVFTWTPSEDQGPGTYTVTVRVTDDGTPALDDFETITITVGEVNAAPS